MADRLQTRGSPSLDGVAVAFGDSARTRSVVIPNGDYTPPIWLRTEAGLVVKVDDLPWRGVLPCRDIEVLSEDPNAADFEFAHYCDWRHHSGAPTNDTDVLRGSNAAGSEPYLFDNIGAVPPTPDIMHVVSGADVPAGCPTSNALRVTWQQTGQNKNLRKVVDVPDLTTPLYTRMYSYVGAGWDGQNMNHPHNLDVNEMVPPLQAAMWAIQHNPGDSAGTFRPRMTFSVTSDGGAQRRFQGPMMNAQAWIRNEYRREIVNSSPIHMRIWPFHYNASGTLVADADDYISETSPFPTLQAWYDAGGYLVVNSTGGTVTSAQGARRYIFGNEDPALATGSTRYYYFAAVAAALQKIDDRLQN